MGVIAAVDGVFPCVDDLLFVEWDFESGFCGPDFFYMDFRSLFKWFRLCVRLVLLGSPNSDRENGRGVAKQMLLYFVMVSASGLWIFGTLFGCFVCALSGI